MIELVLYTAVALLCIVVVALLVRRGQGPEPAKTESDFVRDFSDDVWLNLAERIFDSTDYRWLRDEVGFPELAKALARSRRQMALAWLHAVRLSFEALIRIPEPAVVTGGAQNGGPGSWRVLWMTLRFHGLLTYATLVVRLFGPYHQLVPSFRWLPALAGSRHCRPRYHAAGTGFVV